MGRSSDWEREGRVRVRVFLYVGTLVVLAVRGERVLAVCTLQFCMPYVLTTHP